ncbi:MAG: aminoacetone oxidase family FAD-binding enzyme [Clostridia bacterium]
MMTYDALIIGGGAAGITAAIVAARKGVSVAILEKEDRIGKKLLATGNGKCNLAGSLPLDLQYNTSLVGEVFNRYGLGEILKFLRSTGLMIKEVEGRFYPYSELSANVLNSIRAELEKLAVPVFCGVEVTNIIKTSDCFIARSGKDFKGKNIILATGSRAGFGTESLHLFAPFNHRITLLNPSLVPFITDTAHIKGLKGVRLKASVSLVVDGKVLRQVNDEIIFKDNGLSGSAIFALSSALARNKQGALTEVVIDFLPEFSLGELEKELNARRLAGHGLKGVFHKEIINNLHKRLPEGGGAKEAAKLLKDYRIKVKGLSSFSLAQVVSGGLDNRDFDFISMESCLQKGLFAAGEALDVDGECGGYNLMWAWASGMCAAEGAYNNLQ